MLLVRMIQSCWTSTFLSVICDWTHVNSSFGVSSLHSESILLQLVIFKWIMWSGFCRNKLKQTNLFPWCYFNTRVVIWRSFIESIELFVQFLSLVEISEASRDKCWNWRRFGYSRCIFGLFRTTNILAIKCVNFERTNKNQLFNSSNTLNKADVPPNPHFQRVFILYTQVSRRLVN